MEAFGWQCPAPLPRAGADTRAAGSVGWGSGPRASPAHEGSMQQGMKAGQGRVCDPGKPLDFVRLAANRVGLHPAGTWEGRAGPLQDVQAEAKVA